MATSSSSCECYFSSVLVIFTAIEIDQSCSEDLRQARYCPQCLAIPLVYKSSCTSQRRSTRNIRNAINSRDASKKHSKYHFFGLCDTGYQMCNTAITDGLMAEVRKFTIFCQSPILCIINQKKEFFPKGQVQNKTAFICKFPSGINSDKVMGDKSILLYTTQNAKQGSVPFRHWVHGVQSAQVSNATLHLSCSGSFSVPLNDINNHHAKYSSDC